MNASIHNLSIISNQPIHNYPIQVHKAMVRDEEHVKPYGSTLQDLGIVPMEERRPIGLYLTNNLIDTNQSVVDIFYR
jgi:hypothetical protein